MAVKYNFKCRVVNHKEAEQYRNLACTFEWNYDYDLPDQNLIKEIKKYYPTVVPPFVIIYDDALSERNFFDGTDNKATVSNLQRLNTVPHVSKDIWITVQPQIKTYINVADYNLIKTMSVRENDLQPPIGET